MKQDFIRLRLWAVMLMLMSVGMAHGQTVYLGDANGDGKIDISDVTTTTDIILGKRTPLTVESGESVIRTRGITGSYGGKNYANGYEYVNLGLPSGTCWATCNVGAKSPEAYGLYYAWGETEYTKASDGEWETYKWCDGTEKTLTKYNSDSNYGTVDNKTTLEAADDAATVECGDMWHTPTQEEWAELVAECTWEWTTKNGEKGYEVKGTNGNSIFLPACGCYDGTDFKGVGEYGLYWSSTLYGSGSAYCVYIDETEYDFYSNARFMGFNIRPVVSEESLKTKPTCAFSISITLSVGETCLQALTTNSDGAVTYSSSDESVATVDASTGQVTAVGAGTATITATVAATNEYQSATSTYTVTVGNVYSGHEYVDLGLPSGLLWATCNLGSDSPEVYGEYFAWGETTGHTSGDGRWFEYKYYDLGKSETELVKYCTNSNNGMVDNLTTLESSDDAATANWGGLWRMPTKEEWQELLDNCTWTKTFNPVGGCIVTGKNGNSIFLPASGDWEGEGVCDLDDLGSYWSSSLDTDHNGYAYGLFFNANTDELTIDYYERDFGQSVRPVFSAESLNTKPTGTFSISIVVGSTFKMPLVTNSNATVYYSSSNDNVASVIKNAGEVTAIAPGEAVITAYVESDGTFQAAEFSYNLTVLPDQGDVDQGYTDEQYSKGTNGNVNFDDKE